MFFRPAFFHAALSGTRLAPLVWGLWRIWRGLWKCHSSCRAQRNWKRARHKVFETKSHFGCYGLPLFDCQVRVRLLSSFSSNRASNSVGQLVYLSLLRSNSPQSQRFVLPSSSVSLSILRSRLVVRLCPLWCGKRRNYSCEVRLGIVFFDRRSCSGQDFCRALY